MLAIPIYILAISFQLEGFKSVRSQIPAAALATTSLKKPQIVKRAHGHIFILNRHLGTRTLLLGAPGLTTRSKDATTSIEF